MTRVLPFTAACLGLIVAVGCAPAIDPAMKADIDQRIATLAPSGQAYAPPTAFTPRPLVVGQWTQHKVIDGKGRPSFMTSKIVGEEGGAFWFEAVHESYTGKTVTKMLAFFGDRMNPQTIDIRAVKMRDKDGRVNEFPPAMVQMMQSTWRSALANLVLSWQGQPQEDAAVPAGTFVGCFKMRTDVSWGPWHGASLSWSHPAVPLSGMVKSQGIDQPTTMELVAFGDSGAQSELP